MKPKAIAVVVLAAALAAAGAGWKWHHHSGVQPYKIAGWTWGEGAASTGANDF